MYHCPVEVTVDVIGGRWTPVVLSHVKQGAVRFSVLRRLIPDISEKMLAQRLRELESDGIVRREVVSSTPPHVEYSLTTAGLSLEPLLQAMYDWGAARAADLSLPVEEVSRARLPSGSRPRR